MLTDETKILLKRYFNSAVNLYGMIPLYKLLEIYNAQNEPITEEELICFVDEIDYSNEYFDVIGDDEVYEDVDAVEPIRRNLVAEYLYALGDFDEYTELQEAQLGKSYYIPPKEKFLKYEDDTYFVKTLEYISLRAFLRNQSYLTKERADELSKEAVLILFSGKTDIDKAVEYLTYIGLKIDTKQMYDEFITLYCDMANNTRMHTNRGYTPKELA